MIDLDAEQWHDLETALTWYEHIPAQWKDPTVCRDSRAFARIRELCLAHERRHVEPRPADDLRERVGAAIDPLIDDIDITRWDGDRLRSELVDAVLAVIGDAGAQGVGG